MPGKTQTITFQTFGTDTWIRKIIGLRLSSGYTHTAIKFHDCVVEAAFSGVIAIALDKAEKPADEVSIAVDLATYYRVRNWALEQVGTPYDYRALFGFLISDNYRNEDHWFCSLLGLEVFERAVNHNVDFPGLVTPGGLRALVKGYSLDRNNKD